MQTIDVDRTSDASNPFEQEAIKQRARLGVSARDSYDLFTYIAAVIQNGVQMLKDRGESYPANMSAEEWDNILDQILVGMEQIAKQEQMEPYDHDKFRTGMDLLRDHFTALWD